MAGRTPLPDLTGWFQANFRRDIRSTLLDDDDKEEPSSEQSLYTQPPSPRPVRVPFLLKPSLNRGAQYSMRDELQFRQKGEAKPKYYPQRHNPSNMDPADFPPRPDRSTPPLVPPPDLYQPYAVQVLKQKQSYDPFIQRRIVEQAKKREALQHLLTTTTHLRDWVFEDTDAPWPEYLDSSEDEATHLEMAQTYVSNADRILQDAVPQQVFNQLTFDIDKDLPNLMHFIDQAEDQGVIPPTYQSRTLGNDSEDLGSLAKKVVLAFTKTAERETEDNEGLLVKWMVDRFMTATVGSGQEQAVMVYRNPHSVKSTHYRVDRVVFRGWVRFSKVAFSFVGSPQDDQYAYAVPVSWINGLDFANTYQLLQFDSQVQAALALPEMGMLCVSQY